MRRKDREITESNDILKIVDEAKILHLGLFDGDYPYVVPLHYSYEYKNEHKYFVYIFSPTAKARIIDKRYSGIYYKRRSSPWLNFSSKVLQYLIFNLGISD